jgi:5-methyltetrahydropteroyltriglutamate--homocysteine methyltransferase
MEAIDRLDTDVNSIENARSDNATLEAFQRVGYEKGFGPGLYDIHSPVVPPIDIMYEKLSSFLKVLDVEHTVVNPDCGLKTRGWPETILALKHMVAAAHNVRRNLGIETQ